MKLTVAIVLLALGLASAFTLEDSVRDDLDLFDTDGLDDIDIDLELSDDSSLDEVRSKWRLIRNMYQVIEAMEQKSQGELRHKRFIDSWWAKIKKPFVDAANKIGNFFKNTFEKAKKAFSSIVKKLDYKKAVQKLIPYINSKMTVKLCEKVCVTYANVILGPAAGSAKPACNPLCDGALAKLEETAG